MAKWPEALNKFLQRYIDKNYVEGAILCGSYASGCQNESSDIDVHIVTADTEIYRERGNCYIDGFLIEYFINPVRQIKTYLKDDYEKGIICNANMFGYGKILFDRNGCLQKLQSLALDYLAKEFPEMDENERQMSCYYIWDYLDEMKSLIKEGYSIEAVYASALLALIKLYCSVHKIPQIVPSKLEKLLRDSEYAERYHFSKLPPKEFNELVVACLYADPKCKLETITELYEYVVSSCGGFDIGCYKLKSLAE